MVTLYWVVGIALFLTVSFFIASRIGKVAAQEPPRPSIIEKTFNQHCHYCNLSVYADEPFIKRRCPNCNEYGCFYHAECGRDLHNKKQRCRGVDVSHSTGHTINLNYSHHNMCAQCGLAREHWQEWTCTHNPNIPPSRRVYFTEDDKAWLRSHKITTEEVGVVGG